MKRNLLGILLAVTLLPETALAERVYRWVDDEGKVHFGRTLPPEYADKPYQILNQDGVVIERVDDPLALLAPAQADAEKDKKPAPLFSEDEVRLRSDRLLVLKYQSVEDIREAMELEVAQLVYDERLTVQSQSSTMQAMTGQVHTAADRQRAGLPPDVELEKAISSLRNRLRKSENTLVELKTREAKIRETFSQEMNRYEYLQNGGTPGVVMPEQEVIPEQETEGTDS